MKILSLFTHPKVVPNLYKCLCSAEHKGRYSDECGKQSSSGNKWCPKTIWLQTFLKIHSFVFTRTNKFIQVWNYFRVSKWWQNFHFWVNYPFKRVLLISAPYLYRTFAFSHLADAFIQSDLQMRTIEAIKNQQKSNNIQVLLQVSVSLLQYT